MRGRLQAAVIDLDGTLVDTVGDFLVALNGTLSDLALAQIDRSFIERNVGLGSEYLIRRMLEQVGADASLFPTAWERYVRRYSAINGDHSSLFPGVLEGLERLRARRVRLACLTNKPSEFTTPLLQRKGLARYFSVVFGGDAFERKKPDPLPLLKTCEALSTSPSRTLVVGDSRNDAQAARAARCPVLLVTYGYNHGEPVRAVDADGFVDRLDDIDLDQFEAD